MNNQDDLTAFCHVYFSAEEIEEEAAVEAEEYFDFMDDGPKKGKVDLEVPDDTDSHTTETSPKQGIKSYFRGIFASVYYDLWRL